MFPAYGVARLICVSADLCASSYQFRLPGAEHDLPSLTEVYRLSCTNLQWVREDLGLEDLRTAIGSFIAERDWEQFHSPKNLAMALSVEVAEVVEHFQWLTQEESRNLPVDKLAEVREEIGDAMIYLTELAGKLGIDPVEASGPRPDTGGPDITRDNPQDPSGANQNPRS